MAEKGKEIFTFSGILGRNCGMRDAYRGTEKRLQVQGYEDKDGLLVLRGYAKASDLAKASKSSPNYQRQKDDEHSKNIKHFVETIRTSAKFLPEVILSSNIADNIKPFVPSGSLTEKQQGEIKNLEHFSVEVEQESLNRIDGNHRLEALKDTNYIIPFCIIIGTAGATFPITFPTNFTTRVSQDDEAFLFYFLNATGKKLIGEENFKGLVCKKSIWTDDEIKEANKYLPLLKKFNTEVLKGREDYKKFFSGNPLYQVYSYLNFLQTDIEVKEFEEISKDAIEILGHTTNWIYIRNKFKNFLPQLVLLSIFNIKKTCKEEKKEYNIKLVCDYINRLDKWASKFDYAEDYFKTAYSMYRISKNIFDIKEIPIFVAMPYYSDKEVKGFNEIFKNIVKEIQEEIYKKIPNCKTKLFLEDIMHYEEDSIDIKQDIIDKINRCKIFIADISESKKKGFKSLANPNVMYETGLAKGQNKRIILIRDKKNKSEAPFDLYTNYHGKYDRDFLGGSIKEIIKPNIKKILEKDFDISFAEN